MRDICRVIIDQKSAGSRLDTMWVVGLMLSYVTDGRLVTFQDA